MLDEMFARMQNEQDAIRFVIASKKEKPYDDIHDYPTELDGMYPLKLKKAKDPEKQMLRVVKLVRGKFEKELKMKD